MAALFPNARTTDPATSVEAGVMLELSGTADTHRAKCLEAVRQHPGKTSAELAMCGAFDDWDADKRRHEVARRLPELRDREQVVNGPARKCEATGHKALTWYVAVDNKRDVKVLRRLYRDLDRMSRDRKVYAMATKAFLIGAAESLDDEELAVALFRMFYHCRTNDDATGVVDKAKAWAVENGKRLGKVNP